MEDKNITFEDLPKAMSWMMDKLNKLDSKIDGLNNTPANTACRPVDEPERTVRIPAQPSGGTDRLRMDELPPDSIS